MKVTTLACNKCYAGGMLTNAVETVSHKLSISKQTIKHDLCEQHLVEFKNWLGNGMETASADSLVCPECGKVTTSRAGYTKHRHTVHGVVPTNTKAGQGARGKEGDYVCDVCGYRSTRPQGLAAHKRSHVKRRKNA